jgi:hypothetical protein
MLLELVGLILAVVDFSGLTPKLECKLDALQKILYDFVWYFGPAEMRNQGYSRRTERVITFTVSALVVLGGLALLACSEILYPHSPYPTKTFGDKTLLAVGFILGLAFSSAVTALLLYLTAISIFYFGLLPLAFTMHLMSKPRRGILGSLGLLLAIASLLERFLAQR